MFNKKNVDNGGADGGTGRSPQGPASGHNMIVGSTKLTGKVTAKNDFRIDGEFEGSLDCESKVIIGEKGKFEGDITCQNAVVEGHFKGQLNVTEILYVKESAEIYGEVVTGKLVVQSGSIFEVQCKMTGQNEQGLVLDELTNGKKKEKAEKFA